MNMLGVPKHTVNSQVLATLEVVIRHSRHIAKLRHYFQSHKIKVVSSFPLGEILRSRNTVGHIVKWSVELGEFDLEFCPRQAIKSQIVTDFVSEWTETQQPPPVEKPEHWKMYFDGSLNLEGAGVGVLFISPQGDHLKYVLLIHYKASNNGAEYEALIHGLRIAVSLGIKRLIAYGGSKVVIDQVNKACGVKKEIMNTYYAEVRKLEDHFEGLEFHHVSRDNNVAADVLSKLESKRALVPADVFAQDLRKHCWSSTASVAWRSYQDTVGTWIARSLSASGSPGASAAVLMTPFQALSSSSGGGIFIQGQLCAYTVRLCVARRHQLELPGVLVRRFLLLRQFPKEEHLLPSAKGRRSWILSSRINPTFQVALLLGGYSMGASLRRPLFLHDASTYWMHASVTSSLDLPLVSISTFLEGVVVLPDPVQVEDSSGSHGALSSL
jgi:ribonuclease HI